MTRQNHNAQTETHDVDLMGALTFALCLVTALGGVAALALWAFAGY